MPANAAACFHTSALHLAQYSWPGKHDKGLCLLPGSRFPGVLLPLFQAEQHLCTFFKTSLTIFPCCGIVIKSTIWARSSAGRAFGSHPRGRGFDPLRVHHISTMVLIRNHRVFFYIGWYLHSNLIQSIRQTWICEVMRWKPCLGKAPVSIRGCSLLER